MMQTSYKSYSYKMTAEISAALFGAPAPQRKANSSLSRPSLLTIAEAAEYLGMSTKWLYRNYQDLPHVKIGGGMKPRIRFKGGDLDKWIAARTFDWRKQ